MKSFLLSFFFLAMPTLATEYVTYNIGLAHAFVKYAPERLPHIIKALKRDNADFYCLQEAWRAEDRNRIIEALKKEYPYTHYTEPVEKRASSAPACNLSELLGKGSFGRCVIGNCITKSGDQLTDCVLKGCKPSMLELIKSNQECALGLMANVGGSPLGALFSILNPFKKAPLFAYGGGNGLLILSKKKLQHKGVYDHSDISTLNRRATLFAEVEGVKVYCSHLTANLGGTGFYGGNLESWEKENLTQIEKIIKKVLPSEKPILMMGDFNCSTAKEKIKSDFPHNCNRFSQVGFAEPYFEKPRCTFCEENSLIDVEADFLLDHIFTKNMKKGTVVRVFEQRVQLEDVEGKHNISDHYGLKIKL